MHIVVLLFMNDLKKVLLLNQETFMSAVSECKNFRIEMTINAIYEHKCNFKII